MSKKEEVTVTKTAFYHKVMKDLASIGAFTPITSEIQFMVDNDSDDVVVDYNCMSTGLHYNKKDIDQQEVIEAGFKYWPTWNYTSK